MTGHVLITGGAGCIGSDLCEALLGRGLKVTAVDNLSSGKREHIANLLDNDRFAFFERDLLDQSTLVDLMPGVSAVYHLAANPDVKFAPGDPTNKDLQQNIIATYNVLESMRINNVRRLAFSSTSAIYGVSEVQPIPENAWPRPISLYGATKLGCEGLIRAFANLFGITAWIFRFVNIVGPKVRRKGGTVVGDFVGRLRKDPSRLLILGNGRQAKSYLLSQECVEAMLFVSEQLSEGVHTFNLGCDDNLEVNQIARMVISEMGLSDVQLEYTGGEGGWPGDVPRFQLDVSAINALGWKAKYSSEEAVRQAIRSTLREFTDNGQ